MQVLSQPPVRRRSRLLPGLGLLFALSFWLVPSGAMAAGVGMLNNGASIEYQAEDGEANDVAVTQGDGEIVITESGDTVTLTDTDDDGGCEVTDNVATCPYDELYWIDVSVGEGDDEVSVGSDIEAYVGLYGGEGNDTLRGGSESDDIYGGAGDDAIAGGAGDDWLDDGAGDDVIDAGEGDDHFYGDVGNDEFNGEDGDDEFNGYDYAGADVFSGGSGNDWLDYRRVRPLTASLDDVANDGENCPGVGCESDNARSDIENLSGGDADDTLIGNDRANVIAGEPGSDTIHGLGGDDELVGDWGWSAYPFGAGDDVIDGGAGNDSLFGDFGADSLTGGAGVDALDGDAGHDALNSADGGGRDSDGCGGGTDSVIGDGGDVVAGDCENVVGASVGGPAGPQGVPGPQGAPAPVATHSPHGRVVRVRATRTARGLRISAVATESGRVTITARKAGRRLGSAQRTVQAGRRFTVTIRTRHKVSRGRYTVTSTLRAADGHASRATQQLLVR
jgi:Ca2+-binding RTX toxin-like protein